MPKVNKKIKIAISSFLFDELTTSLFNDNLITTCLALAKLNKNEYAHAIAIRTKHVRISGFYETWIPKYIENDFIKLFRMNRQSCNLLLSEIAVKHSKKGHGGRQPVPLEKALLMALWFFGKGDTYINISDRFNVTCSTAHTLIEYVMELLLQLKDKFITWPKKQEYHIIAAEFKSISGYPDVIGAIDGSQVALKVPVEQQDSYLNRKFVHSINLQAICTTNRFFSNVFIGFPGSAHDARVLQYSEIYKKVQQMGANEIFDKYHLVGDSAYPCLHWLMKPYRASGRLSRAQKQHNYSLSAARVVIENAFGLLKGRWRILHYMDVQNVKKGVKIITTSVILHNFCLLNADMWTDILEEEMLENKEQYNHKPMEQRSAFVKREEICLNLSRG